MIDRKSAADVCAIVLSYGDRPQILRQVLDAVENEKVDKIVVVANAVSDPTWHELTSRNRTKPSTYFVHRTESNLGSAGGYALAISLGMKISGRDYLWLLDDDNRPRPGCLQHLLSCQERIVAPRAGATASFRVDLPEVVGIVRGSPLRWPRPASCAGFHIRNLLPARTDRSKATQEDMPELLWSVYGGLLLPKALVKKIGTPMEELFLYGDDFEWTSRITHGGGQIRLCPNAVVDDLSPAWNTVGEKGSNLRRRIADLAPFRVYYELRNRVWIGRRYFPGPTSMYVLNRFVFLSAALVLAIRFRKIRRFKLVRRAIIDGERGRLGNMKIDD